MTERAIPRRRERGPAVVRTRRDARDRIRVGRRLRRRPWCDWVFARGDACYTKLRAAMAVRAGVPGDDVRWAATLRRYDVATVEAMVAGARYGLHCLGCSAGLMVAMVLIGMSSLWWAVILGIVVLIYKLAPPLRWRGELVLSLTLAALGVGYVNLA